MKTTDIWKNVPSDSRAQLKKAKLASLSHQFDVIVASLDKISGDLKRKGILKTAGALEVPKIVGQHLQGAELFMDNTPENQKINEWFLKKAKLMYSLENEMQELYNKK